MKSLREALQHYEASGMVDFELGGHTYTRPASVVQGVSGDQRLGFIPLGRFYHELQKSETIISCHLAFLRKTVEKISGLRWLQKGQCYGARISSN